jgi:hypothetical protein
LWRWIQYISGFHREMRNKICYDQEDTCKTYNMMRYYGRPKTKVADKKKSVWLISLYLFNYSSNFKILKSQIQLGELATQKYHKK